MPASESIIKERDNLFKILIQRLRNLRFPEELRESYYVGQDYIEDKNRICCEIKTAILHPTKIENFEFWHKKANVKVEQNGNTIVITARKKVSSRLIDDLRLLEVGQQYFVGYMNSYVAIVNERLLQQKYNGNNFLIKTFSVFDLMDILVLCDKKWLRCHWPFQMPGLPELNGPNLPVDKVYLRDYIDACTSFFLGNFDECIRKVITSVENLIKHNRWHLKKQTKMQLLWKAIVGNKRKNTNSFRNIVRSHIGSDNYQAETISENILLTYSIRNKIMHDDLRLNHNASMFCDKAVSTLYYFLLFTCGEKEICDILGATRLHFVMMQRATCGQMDLDDIEYEQKSRERRRNSRKPVDNTEDFDRFMFWALKINPNDLRRAKTRK